MESLENKSVPDEQNNSKIVNAVNKIFKGRKTDEDGWAVVRRTSVKDLVDSFNKLQDLHPEVTLRPKNVYRRPLRQNSKIRWSKPLKENCEEGYGGHTSDEDITATYVTRIDVDDNEPDYTKETIVIKDIVPSDSKEITPITKSIRASLEYIKGKNIVQKRLQHFDSLENKNSSQLLSNTDNLELFNQLKNRLQICSIKVMEDDSSDSSNSDYDEFEDATNHQIDTSNEEDNNYVRNKRDNMVGIQMSNVTEEHKKLVEMYRNFIENLCCVPFALAVVYCSCDFIKIILNLVI